MACVEFWAKFAQVIWSFLDSVQVSWAVKGNVLDVIAKSLKCIAGWVSWYVSKRPRPEEIVTKLRQVEMLTGQVMPRLDAIRQIGVTEQTFYRWSAGGSEKAPVGRFAANQGRRNGHRSIQRT